MTTRHLPRLLRVGHADDYLAEHADEHVHQQNGGQELE